MGATISILSNKVQKIPFQKLFFMKISKGLNHDP
jgi:hypothetical protein